MKIFLEMVGCRLNQSEIEIYARQFRSAGHSLVPSASGADMVVVNTCAVTNEAASDSRQKIRQAARAGVQQIVVTGCWSTLNEHAAAALDGVTRVVSNEKKDGLVKEVLNLPPEAFDLEPLAREPLPGIHLRTRAFIKTQDGCDYHCTFCVTRLARGRSISRPIHEVIADIQSALKGGAQEIVLTGVALGSWGYDLVPQTDLTHLLPTILNNTGLKRLRLSSIEPWDLDEKFFELWRDPRLCRHLHIPLQSGSAATLRRMARRTTPEAYAGLVAIARSAAPGLALTTDIIVGFPGETDTEFQESLDFVRRMTFASGHVFTFSSRPGTGAERLSDQVPHPQRKERNAQMRSVISESAAVYRCHFLGETLAVLWESTDQLSADGWRLSGLTDNYLRVYAFSKAPLWNQVSQVRLVKKAEDGMEGEIIGEVNHASHADQLSG
ncbi:MAG TPA: tRNA (N(6)-L-threonylcarbamoyladenosine(37)-C(2))-methylthiotransferase MtaB [Anaerolineaceae bacterium]